MKTPPQIRKHPKLGDGKRAILGAKAWYAWSHDSWSGPHKVEISGIELDPMGDHLKVVFGDGELVWIDPANLYSTKAGALKEQKDFRRRQKSPTPGSAGFSAHKTALRRK